VAYVKDWKNDDFAYFQHLQSQTKQELSNQQRIGAWLGDYVYTWYSMLQMTTKIDATYLVLKNNWFQWFLITVLNPIFGWDNEKWHKKAVHAGDIIENMIGRAVELHRWDFVYIVVFLHLMWENQLEGRGLDPIELGKRQTIWNIIQFGPTRDVLVIEVNPPNYSQLPASLGGVAQYSLNKGSLKGACFSADFEYDKVKQILSRSPQAHLYAIPCETISDTISVLRFLDVKKQVKEGFTRTQKYFV
jgi:hypothetical protein